MRFLKKKIALCAEFKKAQLERAEIKSEEFSQLRSLKEASPSPLKQVERKLSESSYEHCSPHKKAPAENIIKNYGRAMTNFALSPISITHLKSILENTGSNLTTFQNFIKKKKRSANCIKKIREMLPLEANRNAPNFAEKQAFQALCVIFIKFYAVNWLFNSKIDNKPTHLAYRFKILRRLKDPDHFTYLKDFKFEK